MADSTSIPEPASTRPGEPGAAPQAADPVATEPTRTERNGLDPVALIALITGALGLGAIPLGLGIIGRHRANRSGRDDHGFSTVGIVLGAASMVAWFVLGLFFAGAVAHEGDHFGRARPGHGIEQFDTGRTHGFGNVDPRGLGSGSDGSQRVDPRGAQNGGSLTCERTESSVRCHLDGESIPAPEDSGSVPGSSGSAPATPESSPTPAS